MACEGADKGVEVVGRGVGGEDGERESTAVVPEGGNEFFVEFDRLTDSGAGSRPEVVGVHVCKASGEGAAVDSDVGEGTSLSTTVVLSGGGSIET